MENVSKKIVGRKEAHAGVSQMYVDDERFTAYYDKKEPEIRWRRYST